MLFLLRVYSSLDQARGVEIRNVISAQKPPQKHSFDSFDRDTRAPPPPFSPIPRFVPGVVSGYLKILLLGTLGKFASGPSELCSTKVERGWQLTFPGFDAHWTVSPHMVQSHTEYHSTHLSHSALFTF